MEEIDVWQQESREVPGNIPDTLALPKWTEKRIHFFPPFHEIEQNRELLPPKEEGASWELLSNLRILTKLSLPFQQF